MGGRNLSLVGKHLGQRIKRLREQRGMAAKELAMRMCTSPTYLSKLENGHKLPSIETLVVLAEALGCTLADFFEGDLATPAQIHSDTYDIKAHDEHKVLAHILARHLVHMDAASIAAQSGTSELLLQQVLAGFIPSREVVCRLAYVLKEPEDNLLLAAGYIPAALAWQEVATVVRALPEDTRIALRDLPPHQVKDTVLFAINSAINHISDGNSKSPKRA